MAQVNGPLFSIDAKGSVGKSLTFSKWKGRAVVKVHSEPANPSSLAQERARAAIRILNQIWQELTANEKAQWESPALANAVTPFNAFNSENLTQRTLDAAYKRTPSGNPAGSGAVIDSAEANPDGNMIQWDVFGFSNFSEDDYFLLAYEKDGGDPLTTVQQTLLYLPGMISSSLELRSDPLTPGSYETGLLYCNWDGTVKERWTTGTVIIT